MTKPIFHLNLKKEWFDLISSSQKKEEYREIKTHWSRIFSNGIRIKSKTYHPTDVIICFSNGYSKDRPQMFFECKYLKTGEGKTEWGAEPGEQYYVIGLGNQIFNP